MLTHLTIKNYALIRHLELDPSSHLNVITGETGAGKSIMLGAIGLLLGNRADTKALWDENEKCITEGVFNIASYKLRPLFEAADLDYEEQAVIRREINPNGKSRAFINDTPVTLEVLRKIGSRLMDVHSQHETLELGERSFQLELIDSFAANEKIKEQYQLAWKTFVKAKSKFDTLTEESLTLKQEADFVKFQLDELVKANLQENEQEKLEADVKVMEHAEEIKRHFNIALEQLSRSDFSVSAALSEVRSHLNTVSSYSEEYARIFQRTESIRIELDDIIQELERAEEKIDFDPQQTEQAKERLSVIYQLLHKHRQNDIRALLELQNALQEKSDKTSNLDELLLQAKQELALANDALVKHAGVLSQSRQKVFAPLCKQLTSLLKELAIPDATLRVEHKKISPPDRTGEDDIEILFSANKGIEPRPLAQVASGGEFSRLMFCIKYVMAEKTALPTLILDEIDSGISGEVAIQLGNMMKAMAKDHQLITISHLPQIAAKGDTHYFVFKDNSSAKTISQIRLLEPKERVTEIAKMIGGANPSAMALENAREMMQTLG